MKNKIIIIFMLMIAACNLHAQSFLLDKIQNCISTSEPEIKRKLLSEIKRKFFFSERRNNPERYSHILFIPFLYLNNVDLTQELITSDKVEEVVMAALKEQPTTDNLRLSDSFPHHAIIHDDSLKIWDDQTGYLCVTPSHADVLLRYFKSQDAQLLFYIWGSTSLFMLANDEIYRLVYDEKTNTFSKSEL